ncbi:hypothetical protein Glove_349g140 [Diversispora epigaea]|uniref:Uncharacterized protein n=1 Tax=Diversispora epigaea TaxID=1348612 RepID=A0A397HIM9_9GLOM|nr:hypothetical protein Glove_349g140 [Diversispora epigaea]
MSKLKEKSTTITSTTTSTIKTNIKSKTTTTNSIEKTSNFIGAILFGTAFATRLILFQFSDITQILGSRVEIVTPVNNK